MVKIRRIGNTGVISIYGHDLMDKSGQIYQKFVGWFGSINRNSFVSQNAVSLANAATTTAYGCCVSSVCKMYTSGRLKMDGHSHIHFRNKLFSESIFQSWSIALLMTIPIVVIFERDPGDNVTRDNSFSLKF